jgi:hypothetical protein
MELGLLQALNCLKVQGKTVMDPPMPSPLPANGPLYAREYYDYEAYPLGPEASHACECCCSESLLGIEISPNPV